MKPNTRIINYVSLVQDGIMTVDMVPQDIRNEVTKWVRYFAGIKDETAVKDPEAEVKTPVVDNTKKVLDDDTRTAH
ncbi:hypothetical protein [Lactobacillus intestinalis]|uniref:hypothetical protein n=1 Tax=Lactobacillus intestinalis TaxID=151781 RepID=UPI001F5A3295|nr:hypothetical protein [Lactobacillus intestinalis]